MVTIHKTRNGRHIIADDGVNGYGMLEQGRMIYRVSLPAYMEHHSNEYGHWFSDTSGFFRIDYLPHELAAMTNAGEIKGGIVYEYRKVQ